MLFRSASIMTACTNSFAARKLTNSGNAFLEEGDFNQAISTLKTNAKINPTYHNQDMKLYQFRAVEVNLNDNI